MPQKNTQERQRMNSPWMLTGTDALSSAIMEYQREVLGFLSMRLSKDSAFLRQLQECQSWHEASLLQSNWMQQTFTDYAREIANVFNIATKQVGDGRASHLRVVA